MIPKREQKIASQPSISPVYGLAASAPAKKKEKRRDPANPDLTGLHGKDRKKAMRKAKRIAKARLVKEIRRKMYQLAPPRDASMELPSGLSLADTAQWLRKHATASELALLPILRSFAASRRLGILFQHIVGKRYIVDFYLAGAKLAIELDGKPHESRQLKDAQRDAWIWETCRIRVLRFPSSAVFSMCHLILDEIDKAWREMKKSSQA